MQTLITGPQHKIDALAQHPIQQLQPDYFTEALPYEGALKHYDLIIDLNLNDNLERLQHYAELSDTVLLVNALESGLGPLFFEAGVRPAGYAFALNGMNTFLKRPVWEVAPVLDAQPEPLQQALSGTALELAWVQDQVGMATPRVVMHILNEAAWMVQEGAASREDIDKALRKGTNYPYGPFEWIAAIGIQEVYQLMDGLRYELGPERFPVARLIEEMYLAEGMQPQEDTAPAAS
jgi:3-hydroxybutyryl-CoA dehydrogenase